MSTTKKAFRTLNIKKTKDVDEIKKAYKRLAREYHPDFGGSQEQFIYLSDAYEECMAYAEGTTKASVGFSARQANLITQVILPSMNIVVDTLITNFIMSLLLKKFKMGFVVYFIVYIYTYTRIDKGLVITENWLIDRFNEYLQKQA